MNFNFSVIIPAFNEEKYIERAINSVLKQTYQKFELIIINDGSTDGTAQRVEQFYEPRIRLVNKKNMGVSNARNRGVQEAQFELVAFLDADDEWHPNFLELILRLKNLFPAAGAYATAFEYYDEVIGKRWKPKIISIPSNSGEGLIENYFKSSFGDVQFNSSSFVTIKKVFGEVGGFPEDISIAEDLILISKIAIKYPIAYSREIGATYHINEKGIKRFHPKTVKFEDEQKEIERSAFQKYAKVALEKGNIPQCIKSDFIEYSAKLIIQSAARYVIQGNPIIAKKFLKQSFFTKRFKKNWFFWFILSRLPTSFARKIWRVKEKIKKR